MSRTTQGHGGVRIKLVCRHLVLAVTLAVSPLVLSARTEAKAQATSGGSSLPAGSHARPTRAWIEFCKTLPSECAIDLSEAPVIDLTLSKKRMIVSVNRGVNTAVLSLPDRQHWGVEDRWDYPDDGVGDCEDIQLVKRKRLIEAGFPRRALRMTVVIDDVGQGHAVLMVRTNQGDLILDNKHDAVLPWHRTGYVYVMRESDRSAAWVSLGRRSSPTMTANR